MKLKYIITAILSSVVLFAGCTKEESTASLKSIQVDRTYIAIAPNGGTETVTVTSEVDWKVKSVESIPEWVKLTPTSGKAGENVKISITAEECDYGRQAEIQISAGVHTQFLTVRQGDMTVETVSCKESMEGTAGKTYRVKGAVTSITSTTYGNMYLDDGSGVLCYIYGTLDKNGAEKNFSSLGIELGDVVTVEGPLTYYGTTPELVNVTVIKIEKSLLKLDRESVSMPSDGGDFVVKAAYKGNGAFAKIADDGEGWLSLKSIERVAGVPTKLEQNPADTAVFTFNIAANTGSTRGSSVTISSSSAKGASSQLVTVAQLGLSGTEEIPFTVAEAISYIKSLGGTTEKNFYVKGKVTKIQSQYGAQYGNGTFWLSDDGTDSVSEDMKSTADTDHDFEVYRALWLDNQKWVEGNAPLSEGDEVVICGVLTLYNGLAETAQGKAWVVSVNGVKNDAEGVGSAVCPFTVKGAIAAAASAPADVYLKGKISFVTSSGLFSAQYGNATFWISEDGTNNGVAADGKTTTATDLDFEVFRALYLGNQKWVEGNTQIAVGDEVVVRGALAVYNGISETVQGKAYIYSHNGKTE